MSRKIKIPTQEQSQIGQLETALMETTMLLADEQAKNARNEQAILELSMLIAGGVGA